MYLLYMMISGLAFAGLDLIRKLLAGRIAPLALVFYISAGAVPAVFALLVIHGPGNLSVEYIPPGLGAMTLNFLGSLGFIYSVRLSPLSRTVPLLSLTPVFTALLAIPVLGEHPTGIQSAGIVLVVGGAMALQTEPGDFHPLRALLEEKGALLMVGVALLWSLSGPLDKKALGHASVPFHATVVSLGVGVGALIVLWWRGRLFTLRGAWSDLPLLAAATIAVTCALVFQLLAIQGILVSLVEAFKRSVGSFMAVVLGRAVFGEAIRPVQLAAVAVMIIGVVLLLA